ncbi:MAG: hypothetical protein RL320_638 [Pseudomonadota bacterium]|jgi:hypothetical protein
MSPMKSLEQALRGAISDRQSAQGISLKSVLEEQHVLLTLGQTLLSEAGLDSLVSELYSAVRSSPLRGLRGSELTLRMRSHASAARVRLSLHSLRRHVALLGRPLGIQSVEVKVAKAYTESVRPRPMGKRPAIPESARQRLLAALEAQDH